MDIISDLKREDTAVSFTLPPACVHELISAGNPRRKEHTIHLDFNTYVRFPNQCAHCLTTSELGDYTVEATQRITDWSVSPEITTTFSTRIPLCPTCRKNLGRDPRVVLDEKYPAAARYATHKLKRTLILTGIGFLAGFVMGLMMLPEFLAGMMYGLIFALFGAGFARLPMDMVMRLIGRFPADYDDYLDERYELADLPRQETIIYPGLITLQDSIRLNKTAVGMITHYFGERRFGIRFRNSDYVDLFLSAHAAKPAVEVVSRPVAAPAEDANALANFILNHPTPSSFGTLNSDVAAALHQLKTAGDDAVADMLSAIRLRAEERAGGPYWWTGAAELCKVLARIGTPRARDALLTILKTASRVYEFDEVRHEAARQLAICGTPDLIPELRQCLTLPNAPVTSINDTIKALGGTPAVSATVIIAEANRKIPAEAIPYMAQYEAEVFGWSLKERSSFYSIAAFKVGHLYGTELARPLAAAAIFHDRDGYSTAWDVFDIERMADRTTACAEQIAAQYPLPGGYLSTIAAQQKFS
ncbi:MAG: HEAT repeat domain-containing protein [Anaerolineae bacterium]|nr:HEAT repeat domain-containing protein [Anaerolineae bacterium]